MPLLQQCPVHTQSFWLLYPRRAPGTAFIVVCHKWLLVFIFTYSPTYLSAHECGCGCAYGDVCSEHTFLLMPQRYIYLCALYLCLCVHMQREKQVNPFDICNCN